MSTDPVVIVGLARTPMGAFQGAFSSISAPELGSAAIKAAMAEAKVDAASIDQVVMGCVLSAGQGQAPARQAALGADRMTRLRQALSISRSQAVWKA